MTEQKTSFHQISQHHHYNEMHDRIFHTCSAMLIISIIHYGFRRTAQ